MDKKLKQSIIDSKEMLKKVNKAKSKDKLKPYKKEETKKEKWFHKIISFFKKIWEYINPKEKVDKSDKPDEPKKPYFVSKERFYELLNYNDKESLSFDGNKELLDNRKEIRHRINNKFYKQPPMMVDFDDIEEHNNKKHKNKMNIKAIKKEQNYNTKKALASSLGLFNMNRYQSDIHKKQNKMIIRNIIKTFFTGPIKNSIFERKINNNQ